MSKKFVSISKACDILGISPGTLRKWGETGKLVPIRNLGSNHRRYSVEMLEKIMTLPADKSQDIIEDKKND